MFSPSDTPASLLLSHDLSAGSDESLCSSPVTREGVTSCFLLCPFNLPRFNASLPPFLLISMCVYLMLMWQEVKCGLCRFFLMSKPSQALLSAVILMTAGGRCCSYTTYICTHIHNYPLLDNCFNDLLSLLLFSFSLFCTVPPSLLC